MIMRTEEFIDSHLVIEIGCQVTNYVCSDAIVDNPEALIKIALQDKLHVAQIQWWERTPMQSKPQIGYGGPVDPLSNGKYFFSETMIFKNFDKTATESDYLQYMQEIHSKYACCDLYPSFDIRWH